MYNAYVLIYERKNFINTNQITFEDKTSLMENYGKLSIDKITPTEIKLEPYIQT